MAFSNKIGEELEVPLATPTPEPLLVQHVSRPLLPCRGVGLCYSRVTGDDYIGFVACSCTLYTPSEQCLEMSVDNADCKSSVS